MIQKVGLLFIYLSLGLFNVILIVTFPILQHITFTLVFIIKIQYK